MSLWPPLDKMFLSHISVEKGGVAFLNEDAFDHGCVHDEHHGDSALIQPCHTAAGNQLVLSCKLKRWLPTLTPKPSRIFDSILCKSRGCPEVWKEQRRCQRSHQKCEYLDQTTETHHIVLKIRSDKGPWRGPLDAYPLKQSIWSKNIAEGERKFNV